MLEPYLFFIGRCEDTINFYVAAIGAEVAMMMRFGDSPDPAQIPPGAEDQIMHATLLIDGRPLLMSDGMEGESPSYEGFSLSLQAADYNTGKSLFDALAADGEVQMPYGETFWSQGFGMLKDRFGMPWMVGVVMPEA